jgi:hypothetical protein
MSLIPSFGEGHLLWASDYPRRRSAKFARRNRAPDEEPLARDAPQADPRQSGKAVRARIRSDRGISVGASFEKRRLTAAPQESIPGPRQPRRRLTQDGAELLRRHGDDEHHQQRPLRQEQYPRRGRGRHEQGGGKREIHHERVQLGNVMAENRGTVSGHGTPRMLWVGRTSNQLSPLALYYCLVQCEVCMVQNSQVEAAEPRTARALAPLWVAHGCRRRAKVRPVRPQLRKCRMHPRHLRLVPQAKIEQ